MRNWAIYPFDNPVHPLQKELLDNFLNSLLDNEDVIATKEEFAELFDTIGAIDDSDTIKRSSADIANAYTLYKERLINNEQQGGCRKSIEE